MRLYGQLIPCTFTHTVISLHTYIPLVYVLISTYLHFYAYIDIHFCICVCKRAHTVYGLSYYALMSIPNSSVIFCVQISSISHTVGNSSVTYCISVILYDVLGDDAMTTLHANVLASCRDVCVA